MLVGGDDAHLLPQSEVWVSAINNVMSGMLLFGIVLVPLCNYMFVEKPWALPFRLIFESVICDESRRVTLFLVVLRR